MALVLTSTSASEPVITCNPSVAAAIPKGISGRKLQRLSTASLDIARSLALLAPWEVETPTNMFKIQGISREDICRIIINLTEIWPSGYTNPSKGGGYGIRNLRIFIPRTTSRTLDGHALIISRSRTSSDTETLRAKVEPLTFWLKSSNRFHDLKPAPWRIAQIYSDQEYLAELVDIR